MVTNISAEMIPTTNIAQPRRTLSTTQNPQSDDVLRKVQNLRSTMTNGLIQPKIFQTATFLKYKYLLKNHMNKLTEELKLEDFQSILSDEACREKANEIAETLLFAKGSIQIQNELSNAGERNTTTNELETFVQR